MTIALVCVNSASVGGVYYCANFTRSGAITWTKLTTTGLPSTEITHFRVDYGDPVDKQFVMIGNEIYYRNGGNWSKVLDTTIAAAAASESASGADLSWLYTDPTTPGSVYSVFMTDPAPLQSGHGYAMKSLDYGATWTAHHFGSNGFSRVLCIEAIGDNIWVSGGKLVIAMAAIYYSPNGGTNFYSQISSYGSSGTANLRINPHAGNKCFAWADGSSKEWTYSSGFSSVDVLLSITLGRTDTVWRDPDTPGRAIFHYGQAVNYSTDDFITSSYVDSSEQNPGGTIGPYNEAGSTELLSGLTALTNKTVAYLSSPTDTVADERGGTNTGTPPYTDAVPNVDELSMYGVWWGTAPAATGIYIYADEQGEITDIPIKAGLGVPMFGDRSSWRDYDADDDDLTVPTVLAKYHAEDIYDETPQRHNPWPAVSGYAPVSDGTKYVATDIVTEAELTIHTGTPGAHHAAVTLDADAATILDLSTQEIGLDVQNANTVLAGPTTGVANEPTFRALVAADLASGADATKYLRGDMTWAVLSSSFLDYLHEHAINEDQSAACDGVKVNFITANEFYTETTAVYINGLRQWIGTDYTEDASYDAITFTTAPVAGDILIIDYILAGAI